LLSFFGDDRADDIARKYLRAEKMIVYEYERDERRAMNPR
jgi:hypothetical protein